VATESKAKHTVAETTKPKCSRKATSQKTAPPIHDEWYEPDFDESGRPIRVRKSKAKRSDPKTQSKKKKTVKKAAKKAAKSKVVKKKVPVKKAVKKTGKKGK
jgi:hypothetical protein